MAFIRGNLAIRDHEKDSKELHLFEYARLGYVRYVGQLICSGVQMRESPDRTGQLRKVIVFELTPFDPAVRRS
jgi:5-methylcytosine-specific restriction protein A